MFDIGWGEFLVIGIVALIAIGPKELPGVLRSIGQWMTKLRRMASEFQGQFNEAMREAEMHDLKKQADDLGATARGFANYDPLSDPDGVNVMMPKDTAPADSAAAAGVPAAGEPPPVPAESAPPPALPEPDLGPAAAPKPDKKPDEGRQPS
jgi:sec-independent protein translocase protein TatB